MYFELQCIILLLIKTSLLSLIPLNVTAGLYFFYYMCMHYYEAIIVLLMNNIVFFVTNVCNKWLCWTTCTHTCVNDWTLFTCNVCHNILTVHVNE